MSKELQLLKSKLEFCKFLINLYDNLNFIDKSNKYNKIIEHYQNELTEVCKKIQEIKEVNKWMSK